MPKTLIIKNKIKKFNKQIKVNGDKSLSIRWVLLASQAIGKSKGYNLLKSEDVFDRINPLINWCNKLFPLISTEHAIPWAGLRPMTPSMIPKVGSGKLPGIFYNTGHVTWDGH